MPHAWIGCLVEFLRRLLSPAPKFLQCFPFLLLGERLEVEGSDKLHVNVSLEPRQISQVVAPGIEFLAPSFAGRFRHDLLWPKEKDGEAGLEEDCAILEEGPVDGHVDMEPATEDVPGEVVEEWGIIEPVDLKKRQVSVFECMDESLETSRVVER